MQLTDAQDQVVQAIAAAAPAGWERIVVDCEILDEGSGYAMDHVAFAIVNAGGQYSDPAIELPREARQAIGTLYQAVAETRPDAKLGSFELTIEQSGRYRFEFSYDLPKRLNGEWDAAKEERLDRYMQDYLAEKQAG